MLMVKQPPGEPVMAVGELGLMAGGLVEDKMDTLLRWDISVDLVERAAKLDHFDGVYNSGQSPVRARQTAERCYAADKRGCAAPDWPGRGGSNGCVRSSTWIWRFLSTHSTTARLGGFR